MASHQPLGESGWGSQVSGANICMRFFVFINAIKEEELNMTGSLLIDAMQVLVVF